MTATRPLEPVPPSVRSRLALALDVDDAVVAARLARQLRPWFGVAKVGLELFSAAGPSVVQLLIDEGYDVFVDLKMADIPTTVNRAARVLGALGASYLTLHAFAGPNVLRAGVEGLLEGAENAGLAPPGRPGRHHPDQRRRRPAAHSRPSGWPPPSRPAAPGWCAPPPTCARPSSWRPGCWRWCPGLRPAGAPVHDQVRAATPAEAIAAGADLLVIGRAVTAAPDREAAAAALTASLVAATTP